ncbi:eIF-2-alpha kinase GCN2 [Sesamum angolense]|uniref:EIF-2-alpha kinase GCN2 n=1 Tax=Sesamum angolense TaxID=2727404 RepID=A0AAE1X2T3_9LAMI|nr:eIF-2-alpha kinase GCN2 [Sesamum angolense]
MLLCKIKMDKHMKPSVVQSDKAGHAYSLRLGPLEEESEDETKSDSSSGESVGIGTVGYAKNLRTDIPCIKDPISEETYYSIFSPPSPFSFKIFFVERNLTETDSGDLDSDSESSSSDSAAYDQPQTVERDLLLAHLLRLACAAKGPLGDALPEITSELLNLGILSESVRDMAMKPSSSFDKTFHRVFRKHIGSSTITHFWKTASDFGGQSSSFPSSRYLNDFDELQAIGHGGFGHVVLCKNKLDGRHYAVKKIRLKDKSLPVDDRILREVATLSRLQHQHVVRYYQAWYETGAVGSDANTAWGSRTGMSSSFSYKDTGSSDQFGNENKLESTYLYIQMEYCPRTLRQMFESYNHLDKELAWHLFRQIVEGLAHIHGQGIIHRDLTPNNIFFDARNDIKIGDFGLAKFLKLEQVDQDVDATETVGVSIDGTGQVGTYFYTAPEIELGWPKINEKADMYSLGIVFFELWHPFDTAMERHVVLSDLKLKGELPSDWISEFPEQASLLRCLMSPSPSDRPSATELLKSAFPPQMEYELLDNMLRTIHSSEDTSIYEKIVSAIFDEDTLSTKDNHENVGRLKSNRDDASSIIFTDLDTANRDLVVDIAVEVCRQHCAKHLEIIPMRMLGDCPQVNRNTVKLLTHGGDMVEFCHELRFPFVKWIIAKQGDFDIVGGTTSLTEAEVIKSTSDDSIGYDTMQSLSQSSAQTLVNMMLSLNHEECLTRNYRNRGSLCILPKFLFGFFAYQVIFSSVCRSVTLDVTNCKPVTKLKTLLFIVHNLNKEAVDKNVQESLNEHHRTIIISLMMSKLKTVELGLADDALNRLQTVGLRFCGTADQALPRLRGALPADKSTRKALDELAELFNYLRVWKIDRHVFLDALMHQLNFITGTCISSIEKYAKSASIKFRNGLVANSYSPYLTDHGRLTSNMSGCSATSSSETFKSLEELGSDLYHFLREKSSPGAVGTSIALETICYILLLIVNLIEEGGLLVERMELVAELWEENIKAEFVPLRDPSLTEQYEYASEHDIKCLIVITDWCFTEKFSKGWILI